MTETYREVPMADERTNIANRLRPIFGWDDPGQARMRG